MRCEEHGKPDPCVECLERQLRDGANELEELEKERALLWDACLHAREALLQMPGLVAHAALTEVKDALKACGWEQVVEGE